MYLARQRLRRMDREIYETAREWGLTPVPTPSHSPSPSPPPRRSGNNAVNTLYLYECPTYPYNLI